MKIIVLGDEGAMGMITFRDACNLLISIEEPIMWAR